MCRLESQHACDLNVRPELASTFHGYEDPATDQWVAVARGANELVGSTSYSAAR